MVGVHVGGLLRVLKFSQFHNCFTFLPPSFKKLESSKRGQQLHPSDCQNYPTLVLNIYNIFINIYDLLTII